MRRPPARTIFWLLSGLAWLACVALGSDFLLRYQTTPGAQAAPPPQWPAESRISLAHDRFTLVLLAHPRCPCTRATLGELAILMARAQGRVDATVFFMRPAGDSPDWGRSDLWWSAAEIPGVHVLDDFKGQEARRLGARTSGEVQLYDPQGRLLFHGGITDSRGHSGDNAGRDAVVALINGRQTSVTQTPVFGCALFGPNDP